MQQKKYTNEHIIQTLQECYHSVGKISQNIYTQRGYKPSVDVIFRRFGSWNQALKEAGIPVKERKEKKDKVLKVGKFSNEYIIQQLKSCYEKHGKISMSLYNKEGFLPARTTIVRQFGSWNNAIEAAGLKAFTSSEKQFSKEEIYEQLRACYKENNNSISIGKYKLSGRVPTITTILKYFGSWNDAIEAAGLKANGLTTVIYSDEDYITSLRTCYIQNNNYITSPLYRKQRYHPGLKSILRRFGSWNNALEFAGVPVNYKVRPAFSKEELITVLRNFYQENDGITRKGYNDSGQLPHSRTIVSYFGSWENALIEAGIELSKDNKQYTKRDVITSIQSCYDKFKRPISVTDYIDSNFEPKLSTIRRLFGSWEVASREAGIPEYFTQYTKGDIIEILHECYEENLGSLTMYEYRELRNEPTVSYILNKFDGSWNKALEAASVPLNKSSKRPKTH